jgi:predicted phosphoadenosine phosphosulfate sulfurtransferase
MRRAEIVTVRFQPRLVVSWRFRLRMFLEECYERARHRLMRKIVWTSNRTMGVPHLKYYQVLDEKTREDLVGFVIGLDHEPRVGGYLRLFGAPYRIVGWSDSSDWRTYERLLVKPVQESDEDYRIWKEERDHARRLEEDDE